MTRTFRFLWRFSWPNWLILFSVAAVILLGAAATGVPAGAGNLFASYLSVFPLLTPMLLMLLRYSLCGAYLQLALAFGARRRDFLLGVQLVLVLDVLAGGAVLLLMKGIPDAMHWTRTGELLETVSRGLDWMGWRYPLLLFSHAALGCATGLIMARSKVLGTILVVAASMLCVAGFMGITFGILMGEADWLRTLIAGASAALAAGSEYVLWRNIRRHTVV